MLANQALDEVDNIYNGFQEMGTERRKLINMDNHNVHISESQQP